MKRLSLLLIVIFTALDAYGQERPVYEIGILVDQIVPENEAMLQVLQTEIRAVVGEDAQINFPENNILSNGFDLETAEAQYQTLVNNETDIILAFGIVNNEIISRQPSFPKPTILFGAVNLDLIELEETQDTSGVDNFTYLITSQSYRHDLESFKVLYDFQHVGVLVDASLDGILSIEGVLDDIFEDLGADYTFVLYQTPADLAPHFDRIDAVYLAQGFFLPPAEIEALADTLFTRELPSFTSSPKEDVELGLMATNQAEENLGRLFRRIALTIEAVVNGANLAQLPVFFESNPTLTINWNTAEKAGVPIKYSLIATTEFVGDFINVISEKTYSLLDAIEETLENNLILGLRRKDIELADQDVAAAKSNYLPDISASASGVYIDPETAELSNGSNPEYSTSGNVTLTQTIFSEAANANISIQKSFSQAERENFNATELDLILNAANAYFNVLILKANLQIRSNNLSVTRQNLQIAEQNFEAGQAGRSDILRFRSEMAQNMQALVESINQLEQGFYALNELLNQPIDREIDVEDAEISEGLFEKYNYEQFRNFLDDPSIRSVFVEFLVSEALKNAPELRSIDYSIEATERNILRNGSRHFLPTVAAQTQYNRTFDQWGAGTPPPEFALKDNYNIGLSLSIPIFDRNLKNINRQTAMIQKEQLTLSHQNTSLAIERDVKNAVLDIVNQMSNIELSKVSEESARQSLELTQAAYSNGAVNLVQLLDAQNNYLQSQFARANASYNYLLTSIILERFLGYYFLLHDETENEAFRLRFFNYMNAIPE